MGDINIPKPLELLAASHSPSIAAVHKVLRPTSNIGVAVISIGVKLFRIILLAIFLWSATHHLVVANERADLHRYRN